MPEKRINIQPPSSSLNWKPSTVTRSVTFKSAEGLGVVVADDLLAGFGVACEGAVHAVVEIFPADFGEQVLEQFGGFLARLDHEVEHVQASQNSVALRDVAAEGIAAAFLAADEGVGLGHLRGNELEAHTCLMDRDAINFAQFVEHVGRGKGLHNVAAFAANFEQ